MAQSPYRGYFALVLTPSSEEALKARYAKLTKIFCHHRTLKFGSDDPADLPPRFCATDVGKSFKLKVIGFGRSANIEAVAVALIVDGTLVTEGITNNKVPHVTVSTDDVTKPFASNALLEAGFDTVTDGLELDCTLEHVM